MTNINPTALDAAAVAFRESEVVHGTGSIHDNIEAALVAYREAVIQDNEFAASTAVLGIGDEQMKAVEDAIDERVTGNSLLREKARKFFDSILCEMLDGFEQHFANDTRWNLDRLVVKKANLLVDALLRGDDNATRNFVGWPWNDETRKAVLDSIGDYAAKAEVEQLRKEVESLKETLRYRSAC